MSLDPTTTYIILTWVFSTAATVIGVLVAQYVKDRREQVHEAEITLYQPLAAEMFSILSQKYLVPKGFPIWNRPSPEFEALYVRSSLHLRRQTWLRNDVEALIRLETALAVAHGKLRQVLRLSIVSVWQTVYKELGTGLWDDDIVGFLNSPDAGASSNIIQALVGADEDSFIREFNATVNGIGKGAAKPPLKTSADQHYTRVNDAVRGPRADYQNASGALFAQAEHIRSGLERAMERGKFYR